MSFPRTQYVMAVKRGRKTSYFYAEKIQGLLDRVKPGESFDYAKLTTGPWRTVAKGGGKKKAA